MQATLQQIPNMREDKQIRKKNHFYPSLNLWHLLAVKAHLAKVVKPYG